ncbi:ubiquitin-conjugating enzyme E2 [Acrasis kona]|uniref:Ubiquitin-conjugating enzyme E2 n=1 Tax=Acrasis kona TaxID=1008807 RepID=A0AAW2ZDD8_9EUKA
MSKEKKYNSSHSGIKRIMSELQDLQKNPSSDYEAHPLEDNLFEWHFTVRGPKDSEFEGGIYHGRIILPSDYPYKAPDIMLLTPNGRFQTNEKICLSITSHHQETWTPAWEIRNILIALIGFMPTEAKGIGALEYPAEMRKKMAKQSQSWHCDVCKYHNSTALPDEIDVKKENEAKDEAQPPAAEPESSTSTAPQPILPEPEITNVPQEPIQVQVQPQPPQRLPQRAGQELPNIIIEDINPEKPSYGSELLLNAFILAVLLAICGIMYSKFTRVSI